jgi:hypothetical protein
MIRVATVTFSNISPMTQSKHYDVPKIGRETHGEYEKRTWRNRMHSDENGNVFIPPMALKNSLQGAASFLGLKVPGRGAKTFAAFFKAAVLVMDAVVLPVKVDEVPSQDLFVPSDGKTGSGSRVMKTFGRIDKWGGKAKFYVADETITPKVFEEHIRAAGNFVGLGMFRPERGGFYGRFKVDAIEWSEAA